MADQLVDYALRRHLLLEAATGGNRDRILRRMFPGLDPAKAGPVLDEIQTALTFHRAEHARQLVQQLIDQDQETRCPRSAE